MKQPNTGGRRRGCEEEEKALRKRCVRCAAAVKMHL